MVRRVRNCDAQSLPFTANCVSKIIKRDDDVSVNIAVSHELACTTTMLVNCTFHL